MSCKLENDSMKTLKTFVTGLLIKNLSIHFGEDKTKSILFASKWRAYNIRQEIIKCKDINIKQHWDVTYLRCVLEETMSGEPMTLNVINKINGKLKFLSSYVRIANSIKCYQ